MTRSIQGQISAIGRAVEALHLRKERKLATESELVEEARYLKDAIASLRRLIELTMPADEAIERLQTRDRGEPWT